ncbi:LOW QUALITY PROTEIN: protein SHQ1 homolog [Synchiropus picturatus]
MITPAFNLDQDADHLTLTIRVPYTRTSEFDLFIDGTDFKFYAKPYFLRLTLPGRIVQDGREKARFDIDKGLFTLQVPKETPGENFEGLQMLTSLLAPKGCRSAKPLVEDISAGSCTDEFINIPSLCCMKLASCCSGMDTDGFGVSKGCSGDAEDEEDEEEFDWQVEQEAYTERSEEELAALQKYGFGNQRSGVFDRLQEELSDVIDVKNPEATTTAERRRARLHAEAAAFSSDHYLADLFEDDEIKRLLKFRPWWADLSSEIDGEFLSFTEDEKEQLRKFNNRSYLLDKAARKQVLLSLVDVLLAYTYEVRSTEGEHNVESPWTIRKLSGTLCWLETYSHTKDVLVSFGRRVMCFPLYRHFDLVSSALRDVISILQAGTVCVLKCLLDIHKVFRQNEPAYILNDLYITDYCIWIQRVKSKKLMSLCETLKTSCLSKGDLDLELEELEEAAVMVAQEEEEEESDDTSSSDSSDEDEESDDEVQGSISPTNGGGGTPEDCPLQVQPPALTAPIPQEPSSTFLSAEEAEDVRPSASAGSAQLIEELGQRVAEDLTLSDSIRDDGRSHLERSVAQSEQVSRGDETFLEPSSRRDPLLIVHTPE